MFSNEVFLECYACDLGVNKWGIVVRQDIEKKIAKGKMINDWMKCDKRHLFTNEGYTTHALLPIWPTPGSYIYTYP